MQIEKAQEYLDEKYNRWQLEVDDDGSAELVVNPISGWDEYKGDSVKDSINKALKPDIIRKLENEDGFVIYKWWREEDGDVVSIESKHQIRQGFDDWNFIGHLGDDKNVYRFRKEKP
jgi:hypothetical protein